MVVISIEDRRFKTTRRGELLVSCGDYWQSSGTVHYRITPSATELKIHREMSACGVAEVLDELVDARFDNARSSAAFASMLLSHLPEGHVVRARFPLLKYHLLTSLQVAKKSRYAVELLQSSPLLFVLLIHHAVNQGWTLEKVLNVVAVKRTDIIDLIGGLGMPSMIKLLEKIVPGEVDAEDLKLLNSTIDCTIDIFHLKHWKCIPIRVLKLLKQFPEIRSDGPLSNILKCQPTDESGVEDLLRQYGEITYTARHLSRQAVDELCLECSKAADLSRLLKALKVRQEQLRFVKACADIFPSPPVAGSAGIRPIENGCDLIQEGAHMHHCVAALRNNIHAGVLYVYHVLTPAPATLSIAKHPSCGWHKPMINELKGPCNAKVSDGVQAAVDLWLIEHFRKAQKPPVKPQGVLTASNQ